MRCRMKGTRMGLGWIGRRGGFQEGYTVHKSVVKEMDGDLGMMRA